MSEGKEVCISADLFLLGVFNGTKILIENEKN